MGERFTAVIQGFIKCPNGATAELIKERSLGSHGTQIQAWQCVSGILRDGDCQRATGGSSLVIDRAHTPVYNYPREEEIRTSDGEHL